MRRYFDESQDVLRQSPLKPCVSITFGSYPGKEDQATETIELNMAWYELGGRQVPCLQCFQDAFGAFDQLKDVFDELVKRGNRPLPPEEFRSLLSRLGFQSLNDYPSLEMGK